MLRGRRIPVANGVRCLWIAGLDPVGQPGKQSRLTATRHPEPTPRNCPGLCETGVQDLLKSVSGITEIRSKRPDPAHCAGCKSLLSGCETLLLPHGSRVHIDNDWKYLRAYGQRWRGEAVKGLAQLGITPPVGRSL